MLPIIGTTATLSLIRIINLLYLAVLYEYSHSHVKFWYLLLCEIVFVYYVFLLSEVNMDATYTIKSQISTGISVINVNIIFVVMV